MVAVVEICGELVPELLFHYEIQIQNMVVEKIGCKSLRMFKILCRAKI